MNTDHEVSQPIELNHIKRSMHKDVISSFWTMLQECESKAAEKNDPLLKLWVEGWYRQWNRMTGDAKRPTQWEVKENGVSNRNR